MQLPTISPDNKTRDFIDVFGGYNHNIRIGENEFYDMENLCSDSYPLLAVRKKRQNPEAFGDSTSTVGWIFTDNYYRLQYDATQHIISLYEGALLLAKWTSTSSEVRTIGVMGSYLIILPDKKIVNPKTIDRTSLDEDHYWTNATDIENKKTAKPVAMVQPCKIDGDVLTIDYVGNVAPEELTDGFVWLDTSVSPASLKKYFGTQATWQPYIASYAKIYVNDNLSAASRTLKVSANAAAEATTISFTVPNSGSVADHELQGRQIKISNKYYTVSDNTTSTITLSSGLLSAISANATIYPAEDLEIGAGFKAGDGVKISGFTESALEKLNSTTILKKVSDDNKSIVVTGSIEPMQDDDILTAEYTRSSNQISFYCKSGVVAHQFKNKNMQVAGKSYTCTESTAAEAVTVVPIAGGEPLAVYNNSDTAFSLKVRTAITSGSRIYVKIDDNTPMSGFYAYRDDNGKLHTPVGRNVCIGTIDAGHIATIIAYGSDSPNSPFYIIVDRELTNIAVGTEIMPITLDKPEDLWLTKLTFSETVSVKQGDKACPTLDNQYSENNAVIFSRKMPKMDYVIESQNRLWGCRYGKNNDGEFVNEIYCSKLGDPTNWQVYEGISTDSYAASCGTAGAWTGAFNYRGYPTFFKEHHIHTVYGSNPPYQIKDIEARGVQSGSSMSLAIVNEILFYKSDHGICAYTGNLPEEISAPLGNISYNEAIGCALDGKYYVEMKDPDNQRHLFVYDTATGMWHKESAINATYMAANNFAKNINYITTVNNLNNGTGRLFGSNESDIEWFAETGVYGLSTPDKKYICKLALRLLLPPGSFMFISIQYDSTGDWERIGNITGYSITPFSISIKPRRCDHFRIRLEGTGDMKLYSISKSLKQGSDR